MQRIEGFLWEEWVIDKLDWKHGVDTQEVEEAFFQFALQSTAYRARQGPVV